MKSAFAKFGLALIAIAAFVAMIGIAKSEMASLPDTSPIGAFGKISNRIGPADIYPPVPGALNTAITQANISQNICNPNWSTKSERPSTSYTSPLKAKDMILYHLSGKTSDYELDHLVSLEIGGDPRSTNNLWMEKYNASIPDGGARTKDQVENALHSAICAGTLTLAQAQQIVETDWYAYYLKNLKGKFGSISSDDQDDI